MLPSQFLCAALLACASDWSDGADISISCGYVPLYISLTKSVNSLHARDVTKRERHAPLNTDISHHHPSPGPLAYTYVLVLFHR
jgi:hypothetical protein